ncbi:hypothetical protein U91I_03192 [alpha proteobacterium U9-1i]|nr:hypothetical protein U91I_03192 [alpha proteobacterium U9-1i]
MIACFLLAACATSPPEPPPERVHGCWIARGDEVTTTFRWLPNREVAGRMEGVAMQYGRGAPRQGGRYAVETGPQGEWQFCQLDADGPGGNVCWRVAQSGGGSLDGGRAFIDQHEERLRISVVTDLGERLIFDGRRDGCD